MTIKKNKTMWDMVDWAKIQAEGDKRIAEASADDPAAPKRVALMGALVKAFDEFSWEAREVEVLAGIVEALYSDREGYCDEWRV